MSALLVARQSLACWSRKPSAFLPMMPSVLDLGLTPVVPKAAFGASPGAGTLRVEPAPRRWVRRPHVLKTSSGLLYETLAGVYGSLGFDVVGDDVFRDLVIARVMEPTSLFDIDRVLAELGRVSASHSTRKRTLRRTQLAAAAAPSWLRASTTPSPTATAASCSTTRRSTSK